MMKAESDEVIIVNQRKMETMCWMILVADDYAQNTTK